MDFRKFLSMVAEESTKKEDEKAEKAGRKVTKDIEHDDEEDRKEKKKSLKDWFEAIDKNKLNEGDLPLPILGKDGKAVSAQPGFIKMQGSDPKSKAMGELLKDLVAQKQLSVVAPFEAPKPGAPAAPAAPGQPAGAANKPTTAGGVTPTAMKEEILDEKAPPGMEDVVLSLKKKYPGEEGRAYAIAWSMYNKKHGKQTEGVTPFQEPQKSQDKTPLERPEKFRQKFEGAEDNAPTMDDGELVEAEKWIQGAIRKPGALHKQLGVPADEKIPAAKLAAAAKKGGKLGQRARLAQTLGKMHEAEIPNSGPDFGAGLGAGRSPDVLESKQVNEAMNTLEAAYHEGKSHGLSKHGYACRYNEGSEEHKRYHDGFKEGLDECYGLMPNRGLVVGEESGQDVVDNMASYGAEEGALGEMDKTAYMQQQAKTTPGDTFKAFGQTFKDKEVLEMDAFAFESLDKQLNELLTEGEQVNEGLSVNMSQGLGGPGGQMEDTVSVTAQGDDAGKLLAFIKQVGLGGLGADKPEMIPGEPVVAVASDYGAPKFAGYDSDGASSMMDLIKKVSGGDDYKDEEGHDHADEGTCNECGMSESKCGCEKNEAVMGETETPDQMTDEMAESDGEGNIEADEQGAQIDAALAVGSENEKAVTEGGDGSEAGANDAAAAVDAADAEEEKDAAMSESGFMSLFKKLAMIAEESTAEKDDKAEKAAKKVAKDIEYDEGHKGKDDEKAEKAGEKVKKDIEYDDKKDKKKKVDEWANDAGKDGTQQTFERDIEFMTKVIAGGLNKPKSTGQQTIPVLAGDKARTGDEDVAAWKKLAGLGN